MEGLPGTKLRYIGVKECLPGAKMHWGQRSVCAGIRCVEALKCRGVLVWS